MQLEWPCSQIYGISSEAAQAHGINQRQTVVMEEAEE